MTSTARAQLTAADYTVACLCAMDVESAAVEGMLDEIHPPLPNLLDQNAYTLGNIGGHNVVVAVMPWTGTTPAAVTASRLENNFRFIQFYLLVGIGGGVPSTSQDVRLGDVVVSQGTDTFGGVVQYDLGKIGQGRQFKRTGTLNRPPGFLSSSVCRLRSEHRRQDHQISKFISQMMKKYPKMRREYSRPIDTNDNLFESAYPHQQGVSCSQCDRCRIVDRSPRLSDEPVVHYGTIGSANLVIKDATLRDELREDMGILCVEMEAAGVMNDFSCLVIRGICDYADSHKNKVWQPYAAATAAAYTRELLLAIPPPPERRPDLRQTVLIDSGGKQNYGLKSIARLSNRNLSGPQDSNIGTPDTQVALKKQFSLPHRSAFRCVHCAQYFSIEQSLKDHLASPAHQIPCQYCSRIFPTKKALEDHVASPAHQIPCQYCNKKVKTKLALKDHQDSGACRAECKHCKKSFREMQALKRHVTDTHGHECQKCARGLFNTLAALSQHMTDTHS